MLGVNVIKQKLVVADMYIYTYIVEKSFSNWLGCRMKEKRGKWPPFFLGRSLQNLPNERRGMSNSWHSKEKTATREEASNEIPRRS